MSEPLSQYQVTPWPASQYDEDPDPVQGAEIGEGGPKVVASPAQLQAMGIGTNVSTFGAVGDGVTDDAAAIQAAIDAVGSGGGVVYFPRGDYLIGTPLTVGGEGDARTGVVLRGEVCTGAAPGAMLRYAGNEEDAGILLIRNADVGVVENLGFHANALANTCVELTHVDGDARDVRGWRFQNCYFGSALVNNVSVAGSGDNAYGDASGLLFSGCYFAASQGGATTVAHYRCTSQYTLGVTFVGPVFSAAADVNYPLHGVSLQAGTAVVFGGVADPLGESVFYLDGDDGIDAPGLSVYGMECQSGGKLLVTALAGTSANTPLRPVVLSGIYAADIDAPAETEQIYWDVPTTGTLVLEGCQLVGDVNIDDATANVLAVGTHLLANSHFITNPDRVFGTWFESNVPHVRSAPVDPSAWTVGTEVATVISVTITLPVAGKTAVRLWLSDAAAGAPTGVAPSGGTSVTTGTVLKAHTANVYYDLVSDANGQIVVAVTEAAAKSFYLNVAMPNAPVSSQVITFAGP